MAKKMLKVRLKFGPSWERLKAKIPKMNKRVKKQMDRLGDEISQDYITKIKENAPAFSTYLKESVELISVQNKTRPDQWFVSVTAPYAIFQEEGVFPHFVWRNSLSYAGYTFGEWMDAHGYTGKGMWVGLSNTKMGTENAFFARSIREMNPTVNARIGKLFAEVKAETKRK